MATHEGNLIATGLRAAVVVSRFNRYVTERLLSGALDSFVRHGGDPASADVVWVPGAYELPLAARHAAGAQHYHLVVALGAVIRGETPHFDYVAANAAGGLSRVSLDTGVPVGFGLLTTDSVEQAVERAGAKAGNKGAEAMETAIEMANLLKSFQPSDR